MTAHGSREPVLAGLGSGTTSPIDVRDASVAERHQMVHHQGGTRRVVVGHAVEPVPLGGPGDEDDGDRSRRGGDSRDLEAWAGQDEAIAPELQQRFDGGGLTARGAVAGVEHRLVASLRRTPGHTVEHVGEEGVVQVGEHHAEHPGLPLHQASGDGVGTVVQLGRGGEHGLPLRVADGRGIPHHEGDQRFRDAGARGDIEYGGLGHAILRGGRRHRA